MEELREKLEQINDKNQDILAENNHLKIIMSELRYEHNAMNQNLTNLQLGYNQNDEIRHKLQLDFDEARLFTNI